MSFWTAVVVIVAIVAYANLRRHRHHTDWQQPAEPRAELEREVTELRRRVETLERILTDNRDSLAREIESLRDR